MNTYRLSFHHSSREAKVRADSPEAAAAKYNLTITETDKGLWLESRGGLVGYIEKIG